MFVQAVCVILVLEGSNLISQAYNSLLSECVHTENIRLTGFCVKCIIIFLSIRYPDMYRVTPLTGIWKPRSTAAQRHRKNSHALAFTPLRTVGTPVCARSAQSRDRS